MAVDIMARIATANMISSSVKPKLRSELGVGCGRFGRNSHRQNIRLDESIDGRRHHGENRHGQHDLKQREAEAQIGTWRRLRSLRSKFASPEHSIGRIDRWPSTSWRESPRPT